MSASSASESSLDAVRLDVRDAADLPLVAAGLGRWLAARTSDALETARIRTAGLELASNVAHYAAPGTLEARWLVRGDDVVVELVAADRGPGIADIDRALEDHYSTGGGLGLGLPGVRRLMDELEVTSTPGRGTTVRARRWLR